MYPADRASNVLNRLLVDPRLEEGDIISTGHSLGGLVIKMTCARQRMRQRTAPRLSLLNACEKLLFSRRPMAELIWRAG